MLVGMAILLTTRGSPRELSYLGSCGQGKIPHRDKDGDENPLAANSGTMLPVPQGLRIPAYIEFYLYTLITYNMYNINIRVNIVFY